jgi:hypothetical protein
MLTCQVLDRSWYAHIRGAESLLSFCASQSPPTAVENKFIGFIIRQLVCSQAKPLFNYPLTPYLTFVQLINYMADSITPSPDVKQWLKILAPDNPRVPLMEIFLEVATICAKLKEKPSRDIAAGTTQALDMKSLVGQAIDLDKKLDNWYQRGNLAVPCLITLENRPQWTTSLLKHPGAPKAMFEYANLLMALDLNLFRATRLHLNVTILDCLTTSLQQSSRDDVISRILGIIDEIFATIPFIFQITPSGAGDPQSQHDVRGQRGHMLLWPILAMQKCFQREDVTRRDKAKRQEWIGAVADFMSNGLGYAKIPPRE